MERNNQLRKGLTIFIFLLCVILTYFVYKTVSEKNKYEQEAKSYKEQCEILTEENQQLSDELSRYKTIYESSVEENRKLAGRLDEYVGMYDMVSSMYKVLHSYAKDNGLKIDNMEIIQTSYDSLSDDEKAKAKDAMNLMITLYENRDDEESPQNDSEDANSNDTVDTETQSVGDAWKFAAGGAYSLGKQIVSDFLSVFR